MQQSARQKAVDYFDKMGRLNLLAGTIGMMGLKQNQAEQQRNQEAESAWVRRNVWNDQSPTTDEDMGDNIILGDVNHPTPVVQQGNNGNSLLTLGLGALLGGGGILLGQMLSKPVTPQPVQPVIQQPVSNTDTSTQIGLGRIEDLQGQQ